MNTQKYALNESQHYTKQRQNQTKNKHRKQRKPSAF